MALGFSVRAFAWDLFPLWVLELLVSILHQPVVVGAVHFVVDLVEAIPRALRAAVPASVQDVVALGSPFLVVGLTRALVPPRLGRTVILCGSLLVRYFFPLRALLLCDGRHFFRKRGNFLSYGEMQFLLLGVISCGGLAFPLLSGCNPFVWFVRLQVVPEFLVHLLRHLLLFEHPPLSGDAWGLGRAEGDIPSRLPFLRY